MPGHARDRASSHPSSGQTVVVAFNLNVTVWLCVMSCALCAIKAGEQVDSDPSRRVYGELPADSIQKFLHDARPSWEDALCISWGPLPGWRLEEFAKGCRLLLDVVVEWEVDHRCGMAQGVQMTQTANEHANPRSGLICGDGEEMEMFLEEAGLPPADVIVYSGAFLASTEPLETQRLRMIGKGLREGGLLVVATPTYVQERSGGAATRYTARTLGSAVERAGLCALNVTYGGGSMLTAGILQGMGFRDFSHEALLQVAAAERGKQLLPHSVMALAQRRATGAKACAWSPEELAAPEHAWRGVGARVVVFTQATHSYYRFVRNLAASLDEFLADPAAPQGSGPPRRRLRAKLVVFTDTTDPAAIAETAAGLQNLEVQHRFVHHYGWPELALRRWETYLEAEEELREADFGFHIDCDALVVRDIRALIATSQSFGVLHADNAFYSGHEVFSVSDTRAATVGELAGFLGPLRDSPRGYWDQACFPRFCRAPPPYDPDERKMCGMGGGDGEYYFYSGLFGGTAAWMAETLRTLKDWTRRDLEQGFLGARVDDESYLNRLFWHSPPARVLTSAFMFPEPPSDTTHPWLWDNLPAADEDPSASFEQHLLRGADCAAMRGAPPDRARGDEVCWNVTGANRWFQPVVLNLHKDKSALFVGSDQSKQIGLHRDGEL